MHLPKPLWALALAGALAACADAALDPAAPLARPRADVVTDSARTYVAVATGGAHSCALNALGRAWCWGDNRRGQLGDSTIISRALPVAVRAPASVRFVSITAGASHTCALDGGNRVWCWGDNTHGQVLGITPPYVTAPRSVVTGMVQVVAGGRHACAIRGSTAHIFCWGANEWGQATTFFSPDRRSPFQLPLGPGWVGVGLGAAHTCAVLQQVECWGNNTDGQVAGPFAPDTVLDTPMPTPLTPMLAVDGGDRHSCALHGVSLTAGEAVCWGEWDGDPATPPTEAEELSGAPVLFTRLRAGGGHTCALGEDGGVYCWGAGGAGQLGTGGWTSAPAPLAPVTSGAPFRAVDAGGRHTCAVTAAAGVACWGAHDFGQLGDGSGTASAVPVAVLLP
ncbi:MAG TPA: hypothetical protein VFS20_26980 [Longimicrobium sp.]|nr:hypothetical protein [Longimicrobium sp.]